MTSDKKLIDYINQNRIVYHYSESDEVQIFKKIIPLMNIADAKFVICINRGRIDANSEKEELLVKAIENHGLRYNYITENSATIVGMFLVIIEDIDRLNLFKLIFGTHIIFKIIQIEDDGKLKYVS